MAENYHGMTLEEIKAKYYLDLTGDEEGAELRFLNGKIGRLWQDLFYYYNDTISQLKETKKRLRIIDEQLLLNETKVKWKYMMENKVLGRMDKWSDSARETAALIETRTDEMVESLVVIKNIISDLEEELSIWKEIKSNLSFISERINSSLMSIAVEAKIQGREPTNIPHEPRPKPKFQRSNEEMLDDYKDFTTGDKF